MSARPPQTNGSARPAQTNGSLPSGILTSGQGPLLTAQEAAKLLAKTDRWVLAEARANRIPHVRLGRSVRFRKESLLAWVAEREQGPSSRLGGSPHALRDLGARGHDRRHDGAQQAARRARAAARKLERPSASTSGREPAGSKPRRLRGVYPLERDAKAQQIYGALAADAPLRDQSGDLPAADAAAVTLFARCLVQLERVEADIADHGWRDQKTGEARPVVDLARRLRAEALDYARELGMTPSARVKLGLDLQRTVDLATAMSEEDPDRRAQLMREAGVPLEEDRDE